MTDKDLERIIKTAKAMGVVATAIIITNLFVMSYTALERTDRKAASLENVPAKKVGSHATCSKCGACISCSENVR